ncbi:MAG TPA: RNA polymerase sigma factor [Acidobacteriaceae bacterium]|jgi:RNA polymerase sigma-70 factor (ECF subfamily)
MEHVIANAMATGELPAPIVSDAGGVEEWMRLYRGRIFRYILFATRDEDVAESLTQDCFMRAHTAQASFRGECAMSTWLMRIAVNLVRDHQRSMKLRFWRRAAMLDASEMSDRLPDTQSSTEHRLIAQERVATVWRAVETLSERQRSIFLLRFVEELELPEIAEAMRMNVNTVKSHLYRALSVVKRQVGEGR